MNILFWHFVKLPNSAPQLQCRCIPNEMCQIACGSFSVGQIVFGEMEFSSADSKLWKNCMASKMIGRLSADMYRYE